jgi:hypothetical protein
VKVLKPTLSLVIRTAIAKALRNFAVATPGIVQSYNAGTRTCSVKPAVHKLVPSTTDEELDVTEEYPVLQGVPVCWPVGRGFRLNATLALGDPVLILALDRDLSRWRRTGQVGEPDDARLHDYAFAVAIPGLVPDTNPIPTPTDGAALAGAVATDLFKIAQMLDLASAGTPFTNLYTASANAQPVIKARIESAILKLAS